MKPRKGSIKVVGYIRVSSEEQAEKKTDKPQEEQVASYIKAKGWKLARPLFIDRAKPGGKVVGRDNLLRMLKFLETASIDKVVVRDSKRMARTLVLDDLNLIYGTLQRTNTKFHETSTGSDLDLNTFQGFLQAMLGAALAALDNIHKSEAIQNAYGKARVDGTGYAGGRVPFGTRWNREKNSWEPHENRHRILQEAVRLIKECYTGYPSKRCLIAVTTPITRSGKMEA